MKSMTTRNVAVAPSQWLQQFVEEIVHRFLLPLALGVGLLQGCAVGPDYAKPELQTPDRWHQELSKGLAGGQADIRIWWVVLEDRVLESLIDRASAGNLDLKEAIARVREARARRGIASGELWPSVGSAGSYQRARGSENGLSPPPSESSLPERAASRRRNASSVRSSARGSGPRSAVTRSGRSTR